MNPGTGVDKYQTSPSRLANASALTNSGASSFQIKQLEKAAWQGSLYEGARRELLLRLYADELPEELSELNLYADAESFFASYDDATAKAVISEAKQMS